MADTKVKTFVLPASLKQEVARASAAMFESESAFIRAAIVQRLQSIVPHLTALGRLRTGEVA